MPGDWLNFSSRIIIQLKSLIQLSKVVKELLDLKEVKIKLIFTVKMIVKHGKAHGT